MGLAPDLMPIELEQADLDALSDFFGDLDPSEIFLEYAPISQPPYLVAVSYTHLTLPTKA